MGAIYFSAPPLVLRSTVWPSSLRLITWTGRSPVSQSWLDHHTLASDAASAPNLFLLFVPPIEFHHLFRCSRCCCCFCSGSVVFCCCCCHPWKWHSMPPYSFFCSVPLGNERHHPFASRLISEPALVCWSVTMEGAHSPPSVAG